MHHNDARCVNAGEHQWPEPVAIEEHRIVTGSPVAATIVIAESEGSQMGLWRVSPGSFTTEHAGYFEFVHILSGSGRIIDSTGVTTELCAGSTAAMAVGWKGRWEVDEELTKAYTLVYGDAADFRLMTGAEEAQ